LIGGSFTQYSGVSRNYIIRLNSDYTVDNSFVIGSAFNSSVWSIMEQSDGKILVGGFFTSYSGVSRNRIIRLNTDGSVDNTFNTGTGFNNQVRTFALQSDGKILVGGSFTTYSGISSNYIIRLNTDGSKDTTYNNGQVGITGINFGQSLVVFSIYVKTNDNTLVVGNFNGYDTYFFNRFIELKSNGSPVGTIDVSRIARFNSNGTIDNTFNIGTGFNGEVSYVDIQSDDKILVTGNFTTYNGYGSPNVVRLNSDGTYDNTFIVSSGFNGLTRTSNIISNKSVFIGGNFRFNIFK
jgi:uncharacterized delta-60 repeat protein